MCRAQRRQEREHCRQMVQRHREEMQRRRERVLRENPALADEFLPPLPSQSHSDTLPGSSFRPRPQLEPPLSREEAERKRQKIKARLFNLSREYLSAVAAAASS
ncbi:hypothetical protein EV182_008749, partial [Spiromyces aspiralis]